LIKSVDASRLYESQLTQKDPRDALSHAQSIAHIALDAECDQQATIVGRLLATLGDDRRADVKLFKVHSTVCEKAPDKFDFLPLFLKIPEFSYSTV